MWSLPLVAVLVAFACASPVPQASQGAIGSSTLRSELSSTESSAISSSQSTERTTPTRHTLRPFSFSPRTLKTHQPSSTHEPTSRRTFKPLGGAKHSTTPATSESSSTIAAAEAAETTSAQNRLVRAANVESWQLAESTSTAKVNEISTPSAAPHALEQSSSSAATTPAVRIGEESTSASTTSLPVRSVRNAEQWNAPGWQLAETSSTANVNGISTPAQSSSSSAATTPAVRIGEESTSASTPSTTSLPVRSVRHAEQWNAPGWQLAETSSTMGIDASTTSALNDTSSTPAIGNSMEDAPWQMEESSSTMEAESTSSISPAVGMSHDDGAPWPQMEESSSTSPISSSSPAVGMSHDDGAPWPQMEESSSTVQAESTSAISSSMPAMGNSMDGQNWM